MSFARILARDKARAKSCLFVTVPDVVGNARRTLELWRYRNEWASGWPLAFVAQDGIECFNVPWGEMQALFLGGNDPWKDSNAAIDIVKTAKVLGKHVHIGRVNTYKRFKLFSDLGADTCDGSGASMYDHMLQDIQAGINAKPHPELELASCG